MTKIQKQLNPESFIEMAANKGLFQYQCLDRAIPVPRLYMVCPGVLNNWHCRMAGLLTTPEQKTELLEKRLPHTFVTKPLHGAYGKGFYVFRRKKDDFVDHLGNHYNSQEMLTFTESAYPRGFIIQQKMENHNAIVALTDCEALQTVRMITFVDSKGRARLIHTHFKPITKPGIVIDTYLEGLTGNVEVPVDIDSGILRQGNQIVSTGRGIITVECHPITGKSFAGFELPFWRDACELVKTAAPQFLPLRTIGWDVALAPDQPYIIEANVQWDPPNQHLRMNEILNLMRDDDKPTDRLNESKQRAISTNT
ncbi:MAG: sugar-transfer associated ATP-grasp domain-containing protein [Sedimentisphaerales bacterium]|jgi:hypothetical protein